MLLLAMLAGAALLLALAGRGSEFVSNVAALGCGTLLAASIADFFWSRRLWRGALPTLTRRIPVSLAVGERSGVELTIRNPADRTWRMQLFDYTDSSLATSGLPVSLALLPGSETTCRYDVYPQWRGDVSFSQARVRVRSIARLCEMSTELGVRDTRRVFPNLSVLLRYAWLAGNQRLAELGIKTLQQRGIGTDFKQLAEYQPGDPVRHIDWKASARLQKPILRQFQDERDQRVMFLIDCGRRMRADDRNGVAGSSHFDQVLNAVMLLAYVALKRGDAVGAMTFGTPEGKERLIAPRKGRDTLDGLMSRLYDLQPTVTHSDYLMAAQTFLARFGKRALVIVITNFRDEDGAELGDALKLLRSRHLVLLASIQETVVRELISQPMEQPESMIEIASAHLFEQSRRAAFQRLAARDSLMLDVEPRQLAVALVNRYNAVKKAGLL